MTVINVTLLSMHCTVLWLSAVLLSISIVTQECKCGSKTCGSGRFWIPHFYI